jgi:hypothetical protein
VSAIEAPQSPGKVSGGPDVKQPAATTSNAAPAKGQQPLRSKNPFRNGPITKRVLAARPRATPPPPPPPPPPSCYCSKRSTPSRSIADVSHGPRCIGCGKCKVCSPEVTTVPYSRCAGCRGHSPLLALPMDLQQKIYARFDIASTWLLGITCRTLYANMPAQESELVASEAENFMLLLRSWIPAHLEFCRPCWLYHPWTTSDVYSFQFTNGRMRYFCLRHLDRTGKHPETSEFQLGTTHYVCRHCKAVRPSKQCQTCAKCETCAGVKYGGYGVECVECDNGKVRCSKCRQVRLPRGAREGCGQCENCAGCLFQFGDTHCVPCGGCPKSIARTTRQALVESGPGYDFYYYNPSEPLPNRSKKIGIR